MAKDYSKSLPEAVAAKYRCNTVPGVYVTKAPDRVKVDLRRISVAQADALVKAGKLPQLKVRKAKIIVKDAAPACPVGRSTAAAAAVDRADENI